MHCSHRPCSTSDLSIRAFGAALGPKGTSQPLLLATLPSSCCTALCLWRAAGDTSSSQGTRHPQDKQGQTSAGTDNPAHAAVIALGDHTGPGSSKSLWAEEAHLISSFQLGVELAEDLLQLFPDHVGKNIEAAPAKARPLLATSRASLVPSADSDLQPPTSHRGCVTVLGSLKEGAPEEETADSSAQGWTSHQTLHEHSTDARATTPLQRR